MGWTNSVQKSSGWKSAFIYDIINRLSAQGVFPMTNKEIGELRRRMKPDRTNLTAVYG